MFYRIIKYPFFGNYMVKWRNPLSEAQMKQWRSVTTLSRSGATIKGLFAESITDQQKATIVLGHPMGKEAKGYFIKRGYVELLRKNGYNVLAFDINGFGESSHGNFSYFEDIIAIGTKAQELSPGLPIGYHGISLGGQWAVVAFADEAHPYEFAIVESAATTLDEFWKRFPAAYRVLRMLNVLLPRYKKKIRMIDRIREAKHLRSLLLIYSKSDAWVPVTMGERFSANASVPTELWLVDRAQHAEVMKSEHQKEYQQKIIEYFNASVSPTSEQRANVPC